jgi:hypothetical protein
MKKLVTIIVIIAVGFGIYYFVHSRANQNTPPVKIATNTTNPDPSNATFQFEDGPITLKKGTITTNITPSGELTEETDLTNSIAYGDLNGDGKTDAAFLLVQTTSGTGVFFNVAAYVSGLVAYSGTNAIFLGDRVTPKSISIANGVITVTYLDRTANEAMTDDPTLLVTKQFIYTQGTLAEKN